MKELSVAPRQPLSTPFFYGWVIVAISALGVFFSGPGQTYSVSVFIDSYIADFGWSRSLVSSLYSGGTLLAGLIISSVGTLIDRFGHRRMFPVIAALLGAACLWMSFVAGPIMLFMGFVMVRLFGQGSMTLIPNTLVPQWFVKKRGRALSLMTLGGVAASAILPPLNTWVIQTFGWRSAWQLWAVLLWAIMAPVAWFLTKNRPEDIGLLPDNAVRSTGGTTYGPIEAEDDSWTLTEALRTPAFWLILFCSGIPAMVNTGLIFHQVSIMGARGLSPTVSASVLSTMAMISLPTTFLAGFVVDRVKVHYVLATTFVGQIIAMFVLLNANSFQMALAYGVIRGLIGGFEGISYGVIWPNYFGRTHLGSIRGVAMTLMVVASAAGPLPFGLAYDHFGGYTQVILLMMAFPALGALAAFAATQPKRDATAE